MSGDSSPLSTLVVMPNWVGDVVMAWPTLDALAASGRRLEALARPGLTSLLSLSTSIERVVERGPDDAATIASLRERGYPEAVVLPGSFRSAWLPFRARIGERWGYRGQWRSALLTRPVRRPGRKRHQVSDYRELLVALGIDDAEPTAPRITLPEERRAAGAALLERASIPRGDGPLIGVFPGAEFGPSKRWPLDRFVELVRSLRREVPRARLLTLAGPKEVWLGVKIHEETGRAIPVLGPDLDLAELASVLAHLDLLITNDSGPMHLTAALGVPCVALFGPTDPSRTRPSGEGHSVLYTDRWCSPCFRRRCPLLHHRCMKDLTVADVADAVGRGLRGSD